MNKFLVFISAFLIIFQVRAQDICNLWPTDSIPYHKENTLKEYEAEAFGTTCVFNITEPTLTVYKAKGRNTGRAVLIIPGGGYELVALYHEGHEIADYLSENGITAGVLKYRIPDTASSDMPHKVPVADARKALSILHNEHKQYGIDTTAIGVMGFSAGSHLAAVLGLWECELEREKPDFSVLVYGVTDLSDENRKWLEESLYYRRLTEKELEDNTLLNLVDSATPPAFLVHAADDEVCYPKESIMYTQKLIEYGVPVEFHLFPQGDHGFGAGRKEDGTDMWLPLMVKWLQLF